MDSMFIYMLCAINKIYDRKIQSIEYMDKWACCRGVLMNGFLTISSRERSSRVEIIADVFIKFSIFKANWAPQQHRSGIQNTRDSSIYILTSKSTNHDKIWFISLPDPLWWVWACSAIISLHVLSVVSSSLRNLWHLAMRTLMASVTRTSGGRMPVDSTVTVRGEKKIHQLIHWR